MQLEGREWPWDEAHAGAVLADQDPPGAGSHSVEDDGRRLCRAERRLVTEIGIDPHEELA